MPKLRGHAWAIAVLLAAFALAPSFYGNHSVLFSMAAFVALAEGLNVLYGFTGYLPFGYVGFFGTGAYGASLAILAGTPPLLALLVGAAASVVLAALLTPLLRLSGAYFSIASLATAEAMRLIVSNPALTPLTKGPYGLNLQAAFHPHQSYWAMLVILALTLALVSYLRLSPFGLALQAVREEPVSAAMAGVPVVYARSAAWLLSAAVAGSVGGAFAWHLSVFYPQTVFSLSTSIFAIVFTLFGGAATLLGPATGAVLLYALYTAVGLSAPQYFQLIYGLLIVGLVLFLPYGLTSLLQRRGIHVP